MQEILKLLQVFLTITDVGIAVMFLAQYNAGFKRRRKRKLEEKQKNTEMVELNRIKKLKESYYETQIKVNNAILEREREKSK